MPFNYTHITTNATTLTNAKTGSLLHTVIIGLAGTSETITLFDNTTNSGPIISVITPANAGQYMFDVTLATGLTIVTAGTTAGDYTVCWL